MTDVTIEEILSQHGCVVARRPTCATVITTPPTLCGRAMPARASAQGRYFSGRRPSIAAIVAAGREARERTDRERLFGAIERGTQDVEDARPIFGSMADKHDWPHEHETPALQFAIALLTERAARRKVPGSPVAVRVAPLVDNVIADTTCTAIGRTA